jgi:hypothetical protein
MWLVQKVSDIDIKQIAYETPAKRLGNARKDLWFCLVLVCSGDEHSLGRGKM